MIEILRLYSKFYREIKKVLWSQTWGQYGKNYQTVIWENSKTRFFLLSACKFLLEV